MSSLHSVGGFLFLDSMEIRRCRTRSSEMRKMVLCRFTLSGDKKNGRSDSNVNGG